VRRVEATEGSEYESPEITPSEREKLLRATELLVVGDILPCLASPVRMKAIQSEMTTSQRPREFSDSAWIQHLGLLRTTGLIADGQEPTELAAVFRRFEPFHGSLTVFQDRRSSHKRFDILVRLLLAERDGITGMGLSTLAKHCGLSESSLFKHLSHLREAELVQSRTEKWGAPYGLTPKGKSLTSLVIGSVEDAATLMIKSVKALGLPRRMVFPSTASDTTHLLRFDGQRIHLDTVETLSHVLRPPVTGMEEPQPAGARHDLVYPKTPEPLTAHRTQPRFVPTAHSQKSSALKTMRHERPTVHRIRSGSRRTSKRHVHRLFR
jgi:predicted transcriptional regulator